MAPVYFPNIAIVFNTSYTSYMSQDVVAKTVGLYVRYRLLKDSRSCCFGNSSCFASCSHIECVVRFSTRLYVDRTGVMGLSSMTGTVVERLLVGADQWKNLHHDS